MRRRQWREEQDRREELAGEHPFGDAGQLILVGLFTVIWVLDTLLLKFSTFLNGQIPGFVRCPLSLVLLLLAGYLSRRSMSLVFGAKSGFPSVIREGVFRWVRHPMYLSEILLYLGFLMISLSLIAAGIWLVAIAFLYYISRYEEKRLLTRFGRDYERYMWDVPMWMPRLRKR
jgi:protein-S-isoprenylcysteine O-methyltransferase Ste14